MAPSTIRKAIGTVKDQTSIGIAKVASNLAPELEVAIVKATSHDDEPANDKYIREILHLTSYSRSHVSACMVNVTKRLCKTRDWIVALKSLIVIHRLLSDGEPIFQQEIMYATRRGTRLLNMSDFRDEAHSNSWDHSAFVRTYALYLDQRLELLMYERKINGGDIERSGSRDERWRSPDERETNEGKDVVVRETPLREMTPERMFGKMAHLQRLLDRFLACRPTGMARNSRMVLVALYPLVKESFKLYADICEVLAVLLDRFFDMEYSDCVRAFDAYASAGKQIDELVGFYNWCKDTGLARSSEYPEVQRITSKLLDTLEEFVRDRSKASKTPERRPEEVPEPVVEPEVVPEPDLNEIKALPAPEIFQEPPRQQEVEAPKVVETRDLVDLREEATTAAAQGDRLALALFAGPVAEGSGNGKWEAFPSEGVTSAWQNPAAEDGKADWELALVETASNLSKQKAALGGGFDNLVLNGMYDQGVVNRYTGAVYSNGGSASSVAMPAPGAGKGVAVLALPAPDGSGGVVAVGGDPFAASASIPPPSYVQMADMEKKQQMLVQEQGVWQQYANQGMQGQTSLAKIGGYYAPGVQQPVMMPYGMPPPGGYYYGATL